MMRGYFSLRQEQRGSFSPEELHVLDILIWRIFRRLHIDDQAERNEIAARILSLYELGRTPRDIFGLMMRLYRRRERPSHARRCRQLKKKQG